MAPWWLHNYHYYGTFVRLNVAGGENFYAGNNPRNKTGGGLKENVPRALPQGLGVELDRGAWPVPPLFDAIQQAGGVHPDEMWRTFNMGIGMVAVVPAAEAEVVSEAAGLPVYPIGRVVEQAAPERVVLR